MKNKLPNWVKTKEDYQKFKEEWQEGKHRLVKPNLAAPLCPKCGTMMFNGFCYKCSSRIISWPVKALICIVALLIIIPLISGIINSNKTIEIPEISSVLKPDVITNSKDIHHDYKQYGPSADTKYKGKLIQISGYVMTITKRPRGLQKIILEGSEPYTGISCFMGEEYKYITDRLNIGNKVIISGRCMGMLNKSIYIYVGI